MNLDIHEDYAYLVITKSFRYIIHYVITDCQSH